MEKRYRGVGGCPAIVLVQQRRVNVRRKKDRASCVMVNGEFGFLSSCLEIPSATAVRLRAAVLEEKIF